jgi:hypothetical protein
MAGQRKRGLRMDGHGVSAEISSFRRLSEWGEIAVSEKD